MAEEIKDQEIEYSEDVQTVKKDGREYIIVGTAHISRQSADLVREVITSENPDTVCIELDEKRFKALSEKNRWENLDLTTIHNPIAGIVDASIELVVSMLANPDQRAEARLFDCHVVERGTLKAGYSA